MGKRIVELEEALGVLQTQVSNERHPLLADDLLFVRAAPSTQHADTAKQSDDGVITQSLGTLTLGERAHFFGANAAADVSICAF